VSGGVIQRRDRGGEESRHMGGRGRGETQRGSPRELSFTSGVHQGTCLAIRHGEAKETEVGEGGSPRRGGLTVPRGGTEGLGLALGVRSLGEALWVSTLPARVAGREEKKGRGRERARGGRGETEGRAQCVNVYSDGPASTSRRGGGLWCRVEQRGVLVG